MTTDFRSFKDRLKPFVPALPVLALLLLAYAPVINSLVNVWGHSEDNSHGFLIVPIFIYMLWRQQHLFQNLPLRGSNWGGVFFVAALLLYLFFKAAGVASVAALTMWFAFVGACWFLLGFVWLRAMAFPLFFLLFMFPVPAQLYAAVTGPLQLLVSQVAALFLKTSSIPILCQGNIIEHPSKIFEVVQACSGLRSIMTMLTLGALVGYFGVKNYFLRALLIVSGIPVAIVVNIFRVYVLVGVYHWWQIDLSQSTAHTALGLGVFTLSLILFFFIYKGVSKWDK